MSHGERVIQKTRNLSSYNPISHREGVFCPPQVKTTIATPKLNETELKKIDFSLFIIKFQKIQKKFLVFHSDYGQLKRGGHKTPPLRLRMHLRGYGW